MDLSNLLDRQRRAHLANPPEYRQRVDDLSRLRAEFKRALPSLADAVAADFGRRSKHETLLADGMTVLHDIDHALAKTRHWMKPRGVPVD